MRAFVAVILPEALLKGLVALQAGLPGRHVAEGNLHLTLAFLGEQPERVLADLHEEMEVLQLAAPMLRVGALDVFGGRKPGLCFADVAASEALSAARAAVQRACGVAGVALKRERFHPHVTLARFPGRGLDARGAAALAARLGPVAALEARAQEFGLFRSELGPEGARYDLLAEYPFSH